MSAKTTKTKRRRPAASAGDSWFRVLTRNLTNMATVLASSGSVLLCLLIAKRFV
ncbi:MULTISPECIES: hypothetical protein [Rhodopseudomonas]|jgi:hypothetical protein|uniref:Uncharacterized protein n=1 Tax=Rhodopseudomonas palustris (strain DX-1) TaxID=652103 RepID=E6VEV7_RHOPX|nr:MULTISPECIES: hypothetical protein [Rhodopseudomonas]